MKFGKIEIRLLNYFLLIALAAAMIGLEFFFELRSTEVIEQISLYCSKVECSSLTAMLDIPPDILITLRNKIVIMFGVLTLVVAIVLMMFIKNITIPLCNMASVAKKINNGDLSQIIKIETRDEIAEVGIAINELTSNLQEVAKFSCTSTDEVIEIIDSILTRGNDLPPNKEEILEIRNRLYSLNSFANSFELLHTQLPE